MENWRKLPIYSSLMLFPMKCRFGSGISQLAMFEDTSRYPCISAWISQRQQIATLKPRFGWWKKRLFQKKQPMITKVFLVHAPLCVFACVCLLEKRAPEPPMIHHKCCFVYPLVVRQMTILAGKDWGWIKPESPIDHPLFDKHRGKIYINAAGRSEVTTEWWELVTGQLFHYRLTCQVGEELEFIEIMTWVWLVVGDKGG